MSFLVAVLLVLTKNLHGRFSMDGIEGVQKQHKEPTPRIGGVAILMGVAAGYLVAKPERQAILGPLLFAGLPAFVFGLAEDLTKKVSVAARLMATFASGVLGWLLTGQSLTSLDLPFLDPLFGFTIVSVAFSAFAVGGIANAINIIDGFNGLASGFIILSMSGLTAIALSQNDLNLALACLCIAGSMMGFWLVNWPWGKIFLGDGGSYFGGIVLAWASIMLVERNTAISPFAALLLCIYPVTEVLFSIFRRRIRAKKTGHPDRLHLHSLIMRRAVRPILNRLLDDSQKAQSQENALTGIIIASMSLPAVLTAYFLRSDTLLAGVMCVVFILGFVAFYSRLVRYKWGSPLPFLFLKPGKSRAQNLRL